MCHSLLTADNSDSLGIFFPNISYFKVEDSPIRGKIITQVCSANEVLKFTTYTQLPGACCYLPDTICSDILNALQHHQAQAAEFMKLQQFDNFLDTLSYQVQLRQLFREERHTIQLLKDFIQ